MAVAALRLHHWDPFHRPLAVQAIAEGASIVTSDDVFRADDVDLVWVG
jgi:PIN domain nuclease of toxin-antitoxin system